MKGIEENGSNINMDGKRSTSCQLVLLVTKTALVGETLYFVKYLDEKE